MIVTIAAPDNLVVVDGKTHPVDCTALAGVQSVHWDSVAATGFVEYVYDKGKGRKTPNLTILDFSPYQSYLDAWTAIDTAPPPPVDLVTYANRVQWAKAIGGCNVTIGGTSYRLSTDPQSYSLIAAKALRLQTPPKPNGTVYWQVNPTQFVSMTVQQFLDTAIAVEAYMQSTFDALRNTILPGIAGGTITTTAQIDAVLAAIN